MYEAVFSAIELEQSVSPQVGFQDHLPAFYGGFNIYHWDDGKIPVAEVGTVGINIVNDYGLLLYTGQSRQSADILPNWDDTPYLNQIYALAQSQVTTSMWWTPKSLGKALDDTWGRAV
jgi:galactokinase/mevalonate kinase-like predicted kinase